jgi:hypothetical protein
VPDSPPAPRTIKRKPQRELGYQSEGYTDYWSDLATESTPELAWPLSVAVYDKMRRQDAQVASVLRAVTTPILRAQSRVDGTGCRDEVTEFVAQNLGLPILGAATEDDFEAPLRGRDRFSWNEHRRLALLMLPFGHSYFEQVYRYDETTDQYRIRKLAFRPQRTISNIKVARDGGLISIQQYGTILGRVDATATTLPVDRLVAYVLEREGANWLGQSLLRSCYKNWLLKDQALRKWLTAIDRNAVGIPVYTGAENEESLEKGEELATEARGGDNAGGAIPYGAKLEIKGVDGQTVDINTFIRYQDEQIARSALGHVLNLGTQVGGQVGSYNLGSVLQDTLTGGIETIADAFDDTASAHVVEDLVDINFGPTEPAPQIVHDEVGVRASELDRVREMTGLASDADLVKFLRLRANPTTEEGAG